ncbi:2-succinyl-5-enolpyruvyl-6-hydroxy-3-cyclohexene-1-carboxylic-acid synthase [Ascidiimonas sp. W6]|uniref:2-succinyl-5-enolpyruvyl-6-hydroxy-3- cyclohexene-1-carboxylic-acid synthase n=1 Tax=Ascidiimonas meishanensis TaxID=3128903 RepID=UPI0030EBAF68
MKYPEIKLAQQIIQHCKSYNIKHIIISPGSRNAPLTMGFYEDPFFNCFSIVDERCAAFFGLGMAQQIKHPVAVICTSGSALLNYYPAISEAYYSDIPLIVISADRPSHKINIGDGQTINQRNIFENHILVSANLTEAENEEQKNMNLLHQALKTSILSKGPVHINAPFEEPLYEMKEGTLPLLPSSLVAAKEFIPELEKGETNSFIDDWNLSQKKLVLVGVQHPNTIKEEVLDILSRDPSVIVLTETTSNLYHSEFFPAIDQLIAPIEKLEDKISALQPDMLITFGGMIISKKIKAFLRKYPPKVHYHIDAKKAYNTYFCLTHHFKTSVNEFFKAVGNHLKVNESAYKLFWKNIKLHRIARHDNYIQQIPFSDFLVYHHLFSKIPHHVVLQLSNSSTVRYAQLFNLHNSFEVYCNRGTSGIDGSTSTALGAASVNKSPVVLVTGDLSFFYDSNALWNDYIPQNFKIILINNGGGGIFRILPGPKSSQKFHTYFETRHKLSAASLCEMFHFIYNSAKDEQELISTLPEFFNDNSAPRLLEIFTPTAINDEILLDYFRFIV